MQSVASTDPGFLLAGGHSMEMSYNVATNGLTNQVNMTAVCAQCHGPISSFDFPVADYANEGTILGVQDEVQLLLNQLSTLLPNGQGVVDGLVKTPSATTNWTSSQLKAAYNWQFVHYDGSLGVHNAPFAIGILKASIADLSGGSDNDSLPSSWQTQYYGSVTNAAASPNALGANGLPNWLSYALGLNPAVAAISVTNGVVWANGNTLVNPKGPNAIEIFTAAEVAFNTQLGTTYQIQGVSSLSGGWQNIGPAVVGTGTTMSYVTPTRPGVQQFYRVVIVP
jgi:hypothetical protein